MVGGVKAVIDLTVKHLYEDRYVVGPTPYPGAIATTSYGTLFIDAQDHYSAAEAYWRLADFQDASLGEITCI